MATIDLRLKKPHTNQRAIIKAAMHNRFTVAACGRRFGKTEAAKAVVIRRVLSGQHVWWLMPTFDMSTNAWRDIVQTMRHIPGVIIQQAERRIELPIARGVTGVLQVKSTHNANNLRGAGLDFAVLDEAAFMDAEVWPAVVRPMLMERKGGALFISTPYGRNWFHQLYALGIDPLEADYQAFHFTSSDNPRLPAGEIESARRNTPERIFREEYMAEFMEDGGAVFRGVKDVCIAERQPRNERYNYVFGVDWGRTDDYTVITVIDVTNNRMVEMDRFNQISWSHQRGRLMQLYEQYRPMIIVAEENSIGAVNIEALQADGLPVRGFTTTASSKSPLIEALGLAIERQDVTLLNDDILKAELSAYTIERLPSGNYRYNAPSGMHDDTVIATALAWRGASAGKPGFGDGALDVLRRYFG